jgi:hypothetical protein
LEHLLDLLIASKAFDNCIGKRKMIISVSFDVKNHVEVMEGWPIKMGDMTFTLNRKDNVLKSVCLSFSNVGLEHAPSIRTAADSNEHTNIEIRGGVYAELARTKIMNWQAIVSGLQIVDLDYDNYELRFHPETIEEEPRIVLTSIKSNANTSLNSPCDFEQMGRAFCADSISDDRIESTAHFREGRIAFNANRYVDAYNNMFLFLETRYCDGKTKTVQQRDLLSKSPAFCKSLEETTKEFAEQKGVSKAGRLDLFEPKATISEKIKVLVELRGKLRHHSLKSPHRWDPNKQNEYREAARFLGAVVGKIVIDESVGCLYTPTVLETFRKLSVSGGFETKIELVTRRRNKEPALALSMSYPTTVVSSCTCLTAVRNALEECEKADQLSDTVALEGTHGRTGLELFSLEFGLWAYTENRSIETETLIERIQFVFEQFRGGIIMKNEFFFGTNLHTLNIYSVWNLLMRGLNHIESVDPSTRIMSLKMFLNNRPMAVATYRVGAHVTN